jgi:2-keto-4-pentenoate hydratase/2-oxohepta-3-ene-1,7-dioic acid hydratase in catechol pathway
MPQPYPTWGGVQLGGGMPTAPPARMPVEPGATGGGEEAAVRLARWQDGSAERIGVVDGDRAIPVVEIVAGPGAAQQGDGLLIAIAMGEHPADPIGPPVELAGLRLLAPVRRPPAIRDFYAFEEHVATAMRTRGREVDPDWYDLPVFYFSNPHTVHGPGEEVAMPATAELDYELEVAAVIGREGADLSGAAALDAIAGFTIFNDLSARDLQRREMRLGLGPAKGKDFASALGPVLVTPDELGGTRERPAGAMVARVNGEEWSRGELADLHHPFGALVAQASKDALVRVGDVIGSGTVGTGCILELGAVHGRERYPYLRPGDVVELEVEGIGVLRNRIRSSARPTPPPSPPRA